VTTYPSAFASFREREGSTLLWCGWWWVGWDEMEIMEWNEWDEEVGVVFKGGGRTGGVEPTGRGDLRIKQREEGEA